MSLPEIRRPTQSPLVCDTHPQPYIQILEQPFRCQKFRYIVERPGTIQGASSTLEKKTYFTIQIHGYQGRLAVIVSCVTRDAPYRQHPHKLVGHNCAYGVCSFEHEVTANNCTITFPKMGVQCTKKREVKESLEVREEKKIDPFERGFGHKEDIESIDLKAVRLCVQVVLMNENRSRRINIEPVVSVPIYNKKIFADPYIYKLSHRNCYVNGNIDHTEEIILLCKKVPNKEDIKIRFFEKKNNQVVWQDFGTFHPDDIYNKTAICFRPPRYHNQNIMEPVKVFVQLVLPFDELSSTSVEFEYLPLHTAPGFLEESRKSCPHANSPSAQLLQKSTREDASSWSLPEAQNLVPAQQEMAQSVNNMNQTEYSTSRRSTQSDISKWNIPLGTDVNIDSVSEVCQVLNMDYNQIELEPITISSGDLEMAGCLDHSENI